MNRRVVRPTMKSWKMIGIGSRETVANALLTLRGTRWLSIIGPRRDHHNRVIRNLYALHSEPMPPQDVLALDDGYMEALDKLQQHPSSRLRELGARLDQSMTQALVEAGNNAPLSTLKDRLESAEAVQEQSSGIITKQFFKRSLLPARQSFNVVSDNSEITPNEKHDPSTKIELGPVFSQNTDNKAHDVDENRSKYENRTTISSSSGFINTTTTENDKHNDKWGSAPVRDDLQDRWGTAPPLYHFDELIQFTANEKNLLARLVVRLPLAQRQQFIDELVGQIIEKRDTPARIRNPISFARYLVNELLAGFEIWSSAHERMAKKRIEHTITDDERKAREAEIAAQQEAANAAHREKLKQWEADLAAQKDNQPQVKKP